MFQAVNLLSGDGGGLSLECGARIQECWEFVHPRPDVLLDSHGLPITNTHNVRSTHLVFHIPFAGVLHGLAGYFEAVLYGNIGLSIHPERMDSISKNMLSWFPIFFPFKVSSYSRALSPLICVAGILTSSSVLRSLSFCQAIRNSRYQCGGSPIHARCGMSGAQKHFYQQRSWRHLRVRRSSRIQILPWRLQGSK